MVIRDNNNTPMYRPLNEPNVRAAEKENVKEKAIENYSGKDNPKNPESTRSAVSGSTRGNPVPEPMDMDDEDEMGLGMIPGRMLPVQDDINYVQGYLRTQIGKFVRVEFLIGTNTFVDRSGVLEKVGISYLILRETGNNNEIMCDMYSVKFVTIFEDTRRGRP